MVKRQTHSNAPLEFDCWMRTNKWKNIFQIFLREAYKLRRQHRKCEWTQPKISERIGWKLTFTSENTDFCVVWTDSGSCRCYYSDGFWVCWILFPLIMQSMMCAVRKGRYIMAFTHTRTHARTHAHTPRESWGLRVHYGLMVMYGYLYTYTASLSSLCRHIWRHCTTRRAANPPKVLYLRSLMLHT